MKHYDRVWATIDLDAITHNLKAMHSMMNPTSKIICVIKTDAYGHGAVAIAKEVEQFD